jgi:hypothetical protein
MLELYKHDKEMLSIEFISSPRKSKEPEEFEIKPAVMAEPKPVNQGVTSVNSRPTALGRCFEACLTPCGWSDCTWWVERIWWLVELLHLTLAMNR